MYDGYDAKMVDHKDKVDRRAVMHRSLHGLPLRVVGSEGLFLYLENGDRFMDATGGAAVACLGHNCPKVKQAILDQLDTVAYSATTYFSTPVAEELCSLLVQGTGHKMVRAWICNSGSEAMEGAMKMARQYFVEFEGPQTQRCRFIARKQSYHGTTLGALGLGAHLARREMYESMLADNISWVDPCYAYRGKRHHESDEAYVERLATELDEEFQRIGPAKVCAFVAEPVVGAALGCVPALPGYFAAVRKVCDKYGALLIMDEIMSGMGRTGFLHAWQSPAIDVAPDLQTVGKGLGGGYQPIAALLASQKVIEAISHGTGAFSHGQTYQAHPVACAAARAVQEVVMEPSMLSTIRHLGILLESALKQAIDDRWYVGDIRGAGLFWGIEFVQDKMKKTPFPSSSQIAMSIHKLAMQRPHLLGLYPGGGTANNGEGDYILIAPPYTSSEEEILEIVRKTAAVLDAFFADRPNSHAGEQAP